MLRYKTPYTFTTDLKEFQFLFKNGHVETAKASTVSEAWVTMELKSESMLFLDSWKMSKIFDEIVDTIIYPCNEELLLTKKEDNIR